MSQAVWLSWENHRRSREMARALDIPFRVIDTSKGPFWRILYPAVPLIRSFFILLTIDARTVVVQNPSLLLTTLACLIKPIRRYYLVQDLHSYFSWDLPPGLRTMVYKALSRFCLRRADLTIGTNEPLKNVIEGMGARGYVLQDPIPAFAPMNGHTPSDERRIVFICTYADDEPVDEVFAAARMLNGEAKFFVTGRIPKGMKTWSVPPNVVLTDFLSETDYLKLLHNADGVLALTTREHTLLCGAYEALAFRKPLILSSKRALREYFGDSMIYVENDARSIAEGVRKLYSAKPFFDRHADDLSHKLEREWPARFEGLRTAVLNAAPPAVSRN